MRRGDFVTVALQGDLGKPRPGLIIQSDRFDALPTATVLPVTSTLIDAPLLRITVEPDERNGLARPSQIMVDKVLTVQRQKTGEAFGRASDELLLAANRALTVFLGIA